MNDKIKIGKKILGYEKPCFIIAEAGVNHNGDIKLAKKLIDAAKEAGVDAIKFQTFKAENLVTKEASMAEYQEKNIGKTETQQEMLKKLELDYNAFKELKNYCDEKGIIFLSTPHTNDTVDFLDNLVPAYKIGSGDLTNIPFLKNIAAKQKLMILGTGMSTIKEVLETVEAIKSKGNNQIILLHCTTNYPCQEKDVNLRAMQTIKNVTNCIIGYSDHTTSTITPAVAVALGAKVIEKHFTLDKNLPGPDHKASLKPEELKQMVQNIRFTETILGLEEKKPTESEKKIMKVIRKSIVAAQDIAKGTIITKDLLIIKRPNTGIKPKFMGGVVGKITIKDIKHDQIISWEDIK